MISNRRLAGFYCLLLISVLRAESVDNRETISFDKVSQSLMGHFDEVTALEFDGTLEVETAATENGQVQHIHYSTKQDLYAFNVESSLIKGPKQEAVSVARVAYDGKLYQDLNNSTGKKILSLSKKQQMSVGHLMLATCLHFFEPFHFYLGNLSPKLESPPNKKTAFFLAMPSVLEMRSSSAWKELSMNSKYIGSEIKQNHPCTVFFIKTRFDFFLQEGGGFKMFFAKDLNFYPIAYECYDTSNTELATYSVSKVGHAKSSKKSLLFPEESELRIDGKNGKVVYQIKVNDVKFNHKIPDDTFSIDPSEAKLISDLDNNTVITVPEQ